MRNELYTTVKTAIKSVNDHMVSGLSVSGAVARTSGQIVQIAQGKINRGLLAEGLALASTEADDPTQKMADTWAQMTQVITEANKARAIVASFHNLMIEAQHTASVITLPIGESGTWTAFNDWDELEAALQQEPELVERLVNQGLSRLAVADLRRAANELSDEQLNRYYDFMLMMGKYAKNEQWIVRLGTKGARVNSIALQQYEAVKRVRDGGEAPASNLSGGLAAIVTWMVDTALQHKRIVDTIPVRDTKTGNLSAFWVEGRVDTNPERDYYAAEEPVKIRYAHFEQIEATNNKESTVDAATREAHASWVEVAEEWMETVETIHTIAAESRKPLQYRLRSGITVEDLERVKEESLAGILDREGKKQAEFEAKRAGVKLSTQRDSREGWKAAIQGVLNASQIAELNKLRKDAGLSGDIDTLIEAARR